MENAEQKLESLEERKIRFFCGGERKGRTILQPALAPSCRALPIFQRQIEPWVLAHGLSLGMGKRGAKGDS